MKQHVTIVGALYIGLGVLGLLAALIVFMGTGGAGLIVLAAEGGGEAVPILWTIACGVSSFLAILALPGVIGGVGLLKYKQWARYLVLILGVLNLFNVPVGTIIGVYTLWVLLQDETAELFDSESLTLAVPEV